MDSMYVSSIFVGNLPPWATYQDLLEVFSAYGAIRRCTIPPRGFYCIPYGFVTFRCLGSAQRALRSEIWLGGNRLNIRIAYWQTLPQVRHPGCYSSDNHNNASVVNHKTILADTCTFSGSPRLGDHPESLRATTSSPSGSHFHQIRDRRLSRSLAPCDDSTENYGDNDHESHATYHTDRDDHSDHVEERHSPSPRTFTRACSRSPLIEYGVHATNRDRQRSRSPRTRGTRLSRRHRHRHRHHYRHRPLSCSYNDHDNRSSSGSDNDHDNRSSTDSDNDHDSHPRSLRTRCHHK